MAAGHRVGVYKPVASGCQRLHSDLVSDDAVALWKPPAGLASWSVFALNGLPPRASQAAKAEGRIVDAQLLRSGLDYWLPRSDVVLVEGAGGLMTPVADDEYVADLAFEFAFPVVIVARDALGTINQTLSALVVAATFRDGLDIAGIVLNQVSAEADASTATNRVELAGIVTRRCSAASAGRPRRSISRWIGFL